VAIQDLSEGPDVPIWILLLVTILENCFLLLIDDPTKKAVTIEISYVLLVES